MNSHFETLPKHLFSAGDVREMDNFAIQSLGLDGFGLMKQAARFCFHSAMKRWPDTKRFIIVCGAGNNGGDGYAMATIASKHGLNVAVFSLCSPQKLQGEAAQAFQEFERHGLSAQPFNLDAFRKLTLPRAQPKEDVLVDAMLGTGISGAPRALFQTAIKAFNASELPKLAVDIPSGLCANTGRHWGGVRENALAANVVQADLCCSFIALKFGLFTGSGPACCGELRFSDLDLTGQLAGHYQAKATLLSCPSLRAQLKPRARNAHKGHFGHCLLIGGNEGFAGAINLAAQACARMGAGLTSVVTRAASQAPLLSRCPEVMVHTLDDLAATRQNSDETRLNSLIDAASHIVIGPGLGRDPWAQQALGQVLQANKPTIFDADALNLLSTAPFNQLLADHDAARIITPHPGEASRLLAQNIQEIEQDRAVSCQALAQRYQSHALLKGSGSVLSDPAGQLRLCPYGNPGMASGGMGDVLSGILGGLWAQTAFNSAYTLDFGVCLHALAADLCANEYGERGLLASDLIAKARALLNNKA